MWVGHDFPTLLADLYNYTFDFMTALKTAGVSPEWVQVGNEISPGMDLPDGSTNNWLQLSQLINKGYDAIKAVSPLTKVILHIDGGNNNPRFRWWFDNATAYSAKYDVIGLSYYPYWITGNPDYSLSINDLGSNLNDMASRYNKEVMVVEVGGEDFKAQNTYDMLLAVQAKVKAVPNAKGLGVLYWEPEGARSWSGYALSALGSDGKPTKALDAFNDINSEVVNQKMNTLSAWWNNQTQTFSFSEQVSRVTLYDISGKKLIQLTNKTSFTPISLTRGVYIIKAKLLNSSENLIFKVIRP